MKNRSRSGARRRSRWAIPLILAASVLAALCGGCSRNDNLQTRLAEIDPHMPNLFFIEFDAGGELVNIAEVRRLTTMIAADEVDRLVVFSFGWNTSPLASNAYVEFIDGFNHTRESEMNPRTAVACILWDSSFSTARRLLHDVLPGQKEVGDALAAVPDGMMFPLSFWSKASLADSIGSGDLSDLLREVTAANPSSPEPFEIHFIGHSFGCRLVSAAARSLHGDPEVAGRATIRSMTLMQPAMSEPMLPPPDAVQGPIVVTYSHHDTANRQLYSVANVVFNNGITDFARGAIDRSDEGLPQLREAPTEAWRFGRALADMGVNLVLTPVSYVITQGHQIIRNPIDWIFDSLAQLPVTDVLVTGFEPLHSGPPWGSQRRGIFSFGWMHDSVGNSPPMVILERSAERRLSTFRKDAIQLEAEGEKGLPLVTVRHVRTPSYAEFMERDYQLTAGLHFVDCREIIRHGQMPWGPYDRSRWYGRFILGHLEPFGAHSDIHSPEVMRMLDRVLNRSEQTAEKPPVDAPASAQPGSEGTSP